MQRTTEKGPAYRIFTDRVSQSLYQDRSKKQAYMRISSMW